MLPLRARPTPWLPTTQAEQLIVDAVRYGYFQARFDHKNNTVHFGGQDLESGEDRPRHAWGAPCASLCLVHVPRHTSSDLSTCLPFAERLRGHIASMAKRLSRALAAISPAAPGGQGGV